MSTSWAEVPLLLKRTACLRFGDMQDLLLKFRSPHIGMLHLVVIDDFSKNVLISIDSRGRDTVQLK